MYGWNKILQDSLIVTESEVVHIRKIHRIVSTYSYSSHTSSYKEIQLQVDATSYSSKYDCIEKEDIETVFFTINTSQIIRVTKDNIALLLLDDCRLVRNAAQDWCKKKAS